MATLPPPPSGAKPAPAPVAAAPVVSAPIAQVAVAAAPVVATPAVATKVAAVGFGLGKGEGAIAVPTVGGQDPVALMNEIVAFISSKGVDIAALVEAFGATPKSSFPGNKYGRAAYALGNVIASLSKNHAALSRTRVARASNGKPRVSKTEKFKSGIEALAAKFGGMDAIKAALGPDLIKSLKLEL